MFCKYIYSIYIYTLTYTSFHSHPIQAIYFIINGNNSNKIAKNKLMWKKGFNILIIVNAIPSYIYMLLLQVLLIRLPAYC